MYFANLQLNDIVRSTKTLAIRTRRCEQNGNFHGIKIGNHKFEFTFQLPKKGLYTSFDVRNCDGRIRYCMNVSIYLKFNSFK